MSRLCVFIGEGPSERYFFPSILTHVLGFQPLEQKTTHLFQKEGGYAWHLPFPPGITCPTGGKDRLKRTETYRLADEIARNVTQILGDVSEIHYRVITDHISHDKAGQERRSREIEKAFREAGVPEPASFKTSFVENELESWYFAGINEDAPFLNRSKLRLIRELLSQDPEKIPDPKGNLERILLPDYLGAIKTATVIGKHFDIEKARAVSRSFGLFIQGLESDRLI